MMSPRERYQNDVAFRTLVDMLYIAVERAEFTPTEIREAAMLAQIKYEEIRPRAWIHDPLDPMGSLMPLHMTKEGWEK